MYRESEKTKQADMWKDPRLEMGERTKGIFEDADGWHHRLRREATNCVEEGISDERLYEQCWFNALTRSAPGLANSDEAAPAESTYYLFRQRVAEHAERHGRNLFEEAFAALTRSQCLEYRMSGKRVRMYGKLLGSNIGWYSRYWIAHETIRKYCAANGITEIARSGRRLLAATPGEKAEAVTYLRRWGGCLRGRGYWRAVCSGPPGRRATGNTAC